MFAPPGNAQQNQMNPMNQMNQMMPSFLRPKAPMRPPIVHDETNLERLFRFLSTVPLGFFLCYIHKSIQESLVLWAIVYLSVILVINILRITSSFNFLHEVTSFLSHGFACFVSYILMYNLQIVYSV